MAFAWPQPGPTHFRALSAGFIYGIRLAFFFALLSLLSVWSQQAQAQIRTEMKLFSDSFLSPEFEATQKNNYQFVGAQLKTESFSEDNLKVDISGGVAMGAPLMNYLNVTEFYLQSRQNETEYFFIGRKKMLWSELDSRWALGVWQPIFKWNPLAPEEQGLSGIFWQVDKPSYNAVLFASPLYLPNQGPSFEIQNGDFTRGNPWFHQPPKSVRIWDEATDMQYRFDQPNETQILLQNSYGAKVSVGDPQKARAQISYLYGPDNVLAIGYQGSLDLATLKGNVELKPQVFYHSLTGADVTYKAGPMKFGLSGLWDRPSKDRLFDKEWSQPVFKDAILLSPFLEWTSEWTHGSWALSYMRLDIFGGEVKEVGDNLANTPLTNLYPFQEANQLGLMMNFRMKAGRKLFTKLSYTQSEKNDFELVRMNSRFRLSGLWSFFGEMQLLKAGPVNKNNVNDISQFANNDRLMLGVAYAL